MATWLPLVGLAGTGGAVLLLVACPQLGAWPLVLALAPWMARLVWCHPATHRTRFDGALTLFLLTAVVSVWASYDRQTSWPKFWLIVSGVLMFYALVNSGLRPIAMAWLAMGTGAGLAIYFLLTNDWSAQEVKAQTITGLGQWWQAVRLTMPGPRLNPNEAGGVLAMLTPFAVWVGWHTWRQVLQPPGRRQAAHWLGLVVATGGLLLILGGLLMSVSRGAWLALAASAFLGVAWHLGRRWVQDHPVSKLGRWAAVLVAVAVLGGVGLAAGKDLSSGLFNTDSFWARIQFYHYSLSLVLDYPFIGAGLDGFEMLYSTYALLTHVGFISHSHNLFLALAIDQGLPGLLALLWMWGVVALTAWRGAGRTDAGSEPARSPEAAVAALVVLVMLVHGCVETALYGRFVFLLFLPLALVVPALGRREKARWSPRQRPWMVGLAILVIPVLLWPGKFLSLCYANLGAVYQSQAELSLYAWPEWPIQDAVRRAVNMEPAIHAFEQALDLNPANSTANRRLGMIELSLGEYEDALTHLRLAHAAEPWSITSQQLWGEALLVNGYQDEGESLWMGVNNDQSQLEARVFWYEYIGDEEREAAIRRAVYDR